MDCTMISSCKNDCLSCKNLNRSHEKLISLLKKSRKIPGVKKIFVRSGIRYDLALDSNEYIQELVEHHISGCLKIAPEHFSKRVIALMNKDNNRFDEFISAFNRYNKKKKQYLKFYFMVGHPGDNIVETSYLKEVITRKNLSNVEQFQLFTPTPMTVSTCMYWTGLDPVTLRKVETICDYKTKKKLKRILLDISNN